ncbi:MAG: hypothetical protein JXQ73_17890 [Phycisphaerae bacterium]|nr:hypothetical protein [Phycisphaerae bacterium]
MHPWPSRLLAALVLSATAIPPAWAAEEAPSLQPGLPWVQFHSPDFTRPAETGVDPQINLDTGKTIDGYARYWTGLLVAPASGDVELSVDVDDAAQVRVNNETIVNAWWPDGPRKGMLSAKAGEPLPIDVYFYQNGGAAHLRLYWRLGDKPRELIPPSALRHRSTAASRIEAMMNGKEKVAIPCLYEIKSALYRPTATPRTTDKPIHLRPGPHLFIDDYLIESSQNVERKVASPNRDLPGPVVTGKKGKGDDCFQPYLEVIRDAKTKRFRIWYGAAQNASQSHIAYMESDDGINWIRPHRILKDPSPIQFGVSVIDEGPGFPDKPKRFKFGYYAIERPGGLRIAVSPDGLDWSPLVPRVVLPHDHDITNIYRDPIRDCYMAIGSTYITGPTWSGQRRVTLASHSQDLVQWARPWLIITPIDKVEPGETQFYAICGFLARGDLLIGMVKVLHDDFSADEGGPKAGVGWTSLAWTRDGEHWTRDPEVYFNRHPDKNQWDHAMAWIDCQLPVDDQVYLYYGGYKQGHKINRFEERQIGLLRIQRDRYVARHAGDTPGLLKTPPVILEGSEIALNLDAAQGEVRVQIESADGKPIEGLSFSDCQPIKTNTLEAPVRWQGKLDTIQGKPIRLVFSLRGASLYGISIR